MASQLRKTKIVCTIGPTTNSKENLFRLADEGMSVARLNMSHGDHKSHKASQACVSGRATTAVPADCSATWSLSAWLWRLPQPQGASSEPAAA